MPMLKKVLAVVACAAILGTPMVVFYRVNPVTFAIVIPLVKVKHFAMVNILTGREIAPEFLQWKATPERIGRAVVNILQEGKLPAMRRDLAEVRAERRSRERKPTGPGSREKFGPGRIVNPLSGQ
jgi:lipid A disaccharide synthetase